jgi:hypothetical protein
VQRLCSDCAAIVQRLRSDCAAIAQRLRSEERREMVTRDRMSLEIKQTDLSE